MFKIKIKRYADLPYLRMRLTVLQLTPRSLVTAFSNSTIYWMNESSISQQQCISTRFYPLFSSFKAGVSNIGLMEPFDLAPGSLDWPRVLAPALHAACHARAGSWATGATTATSKWLWGSSPPLANLTDWGGGGPPQSLYMLPLGWMLYHICCRQHRRSVWRTTCSLCLRVPVPCAVLGLPHVLQGAHALCWPWGLHTHWAPGLAHGI